jgi:RimJ/RimL family protein N-acetyltransferase
VIVWNREDEVGQWVCQRLGGTFHRDQATAIGYEKDGSLVGGVIFDRYMGRSICLHIAGEGQWLTKGFLKACFSYVFNQMKVLKAVALVESTNTKSLRLTKKLGFQPQAVIPDAGWTGDLLIHTMTPDQCRWLGGK